MGEATIQRTFAGGELAPALHARADTVKYVTGLRTCKNFLILRSGGAANRAGLRLVKECKTNSIAVKIIPYVSELDGESLLLEVGVHYFRFYKNGGAVTLTGVDAYDAGTDYVIGDVVSSGGVNYYCFQDTDGGGIAPSDDDYWYAMPGDLLEVPHPFGNSLCNYSQSGNVITLTSGAGVVGPHELICAELGKWVIREIQTVPGIEAPTSVTGVAGAAGTLTRKYQVTAAAAETYEESLVSGTATVPSCADPTILAPVTISWTAVPGAIEYYIYCDPYGNGTFGFMGVATGQVTFHDVGVVADFSVTPPLSRTPFAGSGNYPRRSATYQQRRMFANTVANPDAIWGSRVGFNANFNVSSPVQDDDAITFRIQGNQHNPVRHLVGLKELIVLTDAGEWTVVGTNGPLAPGEIFADQQTYVGIAPEPSPVVVGNSIIYIQARGTVVRDLRFDQQVEGLAGRDLTVFASHLFDGFSIADMAFQQTPNSTVWLCRSDGTLLGLTYLREQELWGWHRHTTGNGDRIEHVCVVPESGEDVLYVVTRRVVGGAYHRFIERLEPREIVSYATDSFFVDCGLTYTGPPATTFSGLSHLEGLRVAVFADGQVLANGHETTGGYVVAGGAVTLPLPATGGGYTVVHIGLPIPPADLETLDLDVQGSTIRDKRKVVKSVAILLDTSTRSFSVGPDAAHLMPYKLTPYDGVAAPWTGRAEQAVIGSWDEKGRILIRQTDPVPLTVLSLMPNVDVGG